MVNYPPDYIPICQFRFEFQWLLEIFKLSKPKRILEIGTQRGGTLWAWSHNCEPGALIVAVDIFDPSYENRQSFGSWQENGTVIVPIQGTSQDPTVIQKAKELGPYDWLFIDADHKYDPAMADWCNYSAMVNVGGVIALHDITPNGKPDIQVSRLWSQIKKDRWRTIEIIEDSARDVGGIGVVFKQ